MSTDLTSMEFDDDDKVDAVMPIAMSSKPDYPYGLRLCLTHKELDKLDLDPSEAVVGGYVYIKAKARITDVSRSATEHGEASRVEMQIEELAIDDGDED